MDSGGFQIPQGVKNGQMLNQSPGDAAIFAQFSDDYVLNEFQTNEQGRAVHDRFIKIELSYPGDNLSTFHDRFRLEDAAESQWPQRFPKQWQAFERQHEQVADGTPISEWPVLDKGRVLQFKAIGIQTVEQIAAMSDKTGPSMGLDWQAMRNKAKAFLSPENASKQVSALTAQNEALQIQMRVLQDQISDMARRETAMVEHASETEPEAQPKRRGRKPNSMTETE